MNVYDWFYLDFNLCFFKHIVKENASKYSKSREIYN